MRKKEREIIIIAKAKFKIALATFLAGILLLCTEFFFKDVWRFHQIEAVQEVVEPIGVEEYEPIAFDEAEIKDGIHIPTGMIADTGCAEVVQNCGACHSLDLVKQNRASRDGWKEIILWMQETQKLWDLGTKEKVILDYLSKNYGPEDTGRRKNLVNIEWYEL